MPVCSIKQCGASNNKTGPKLTFHRFPVKSIAKKKWIDAIGLKNLNPKHKVFYVCSKHFHESCFNRTLGLIRLRDDVIPSFKVVDQSTTPILSEVQIKSETHPMEETRLMEKTNPMEIIKDNLPPPVSALKIIQQQNEKIKKLMDRCTFLNLKVKRLQEKIRRRDLKQQTDNSLGASIQTQLGYVPEVFYITDLKSPK